MDRAAHRAVKLLRRAVKNLLLAHQQRVDLLRVGKVVLRAEASIYSES